MAEWNLEIKKHLAGLNLEPEREAEIIEELSDHLQQRYEELRARSADDDEALREVMAEIYWRDFVPELQMSKKHRRRKRCPKARLPADTFSKISGRTCALRGEC